MRNTFILSVMIILVMSSFNGPKGIEDTSQRNDPAVTLDTHKWYLTTIYKPDGYTQVLIRKAFINFNTTDGKIGGSGSCNSFGGSLAVDGDNIVFDNIFSTKMYCDDVQSIENDFFKQLSKVTRYEIKGKKLLLFEGDKEVLEFELG